MTDGGMLAARRIRQSRRVRPVLSRAEPITCQRAALPPEWSACLMAMPPLTERHGKCGARWTAAFTIWGVKYSNHTAVPAHYVNHPRGGLLAVAASAVVMAARGVLGAAHLSVTMSPATAVAVLMIVQASRTTSGQ